MCRAFLNKFISILTIAFILGIFGCSSVMENMPAPPDMFVKIELKGPYDKEMPEKFVNQLNGASFTSDWAIPYFP